MRMQHWFAGVFAVLTVLLGGSAAQATITFNVESLTLVADGVNPTSGTVDVYIAALPADRLQARLERASQRMAAAGAHDVVDTIADVLPVIDGIQERIAAGERP